MITIVAPVVPATDRPTARRDAAIKALADLLALRKQNLHAARTGDGSWAKHRDEVAAWRTAENLVALHYSNGAES